MIIFIFTNLPHYMVELTDEEGRTGIRIDYKIESIIGKYVRVMGFILLLGGVSLLFERADRAKRVRRSQ